MNSSPHLVLREPAHQVDPRARIMWRIGPLTWGLPLVIAGLVVAALIEPARAAVLAATILVFGLMVFAVAVVPQWRYRFHRWEISAEAVYTQSGWLTRRRVIIPIARIQVVDTVAGPVEQLLHLATLTVTTASSAGTIRIIGLDEEVARHAAADLTARTQAYTDDAT